MDAAWTGRTKIWLVLTLLITAVMVFGHGLGGHTLQRLGQVVVAGTAVVFLFCCRTSYAVVLVDRPALLACGSVLLAGIVSSLYAHQPLWALTEIALLAASCCCAEAFAYTRRTSGVSADRLLLLFVVFICVFKSFDFLTLAFHSFVSGTGKLDTGGLLSGFSNKRFYGQFQTFTLPLLALPLLLSTTKRSAHVWTFLLLSLWWLIAVAGGTRGTWLGMGVAACGLFICGHSGRRWITWQVLAVLAGVALYWLLFSVLAGYLGMEVSNAASERLTTTLSDRGPLWQQAGEMIREHPWLGFGPMHFADIHNPIAAHPHQAILQWASEWGIPSTLLVMGLVGRGLWATFILIRERSTSDEPTDLLRLCLFASLIGALTQSMVDGVIVMPYSQLWLSLVVGWLMGIHVWKGEPTKPNAFIHWSWMGLSTAAVLFLVYVVIRDFPHLDERNKLYQQQYGGHFQPRFWTQGVIAIKPE
ncbi:O-antigen ligase family protein [Pseudomonas batumici]|uniref:O-antigen ligase family protein n=1 Tax=Pseudomonas batumici TaxID=226910 RepID=UPI000A03390A|nr:O-antigen ligase family protein [Pseudomonas batumici]